MFYGVLQFVLRQEYYNLNDPHLQFSIHREGKGLSGPFLKKKSLQKVFDAQGTATGSPTDSSTLTCNSYGKRLPRSVVYIAIWFQLCFFFFSYYTVPVSFLIFNEGMALHCPFKCVLN